jgi:hypothetical protein
MIEEFRAVRPGAIQLTFLEEFLRPGDALYVNPQTGFVTSSRQMTAAEVADYWTNVIFPDSSEESYSATYPFARARLLYVIETIVQKLNLYSQKDVRWCDFATGEGVLLQLLNTLYPSFRISGTEHSAALVSALTSKGLDVKHAGLGSGEMPAESSEYYVSTLTWTLANSIDPVGLLQDVVSRTRIGGFVCIAESSRILVPFKKSLRDYLSKTDPADSHPSHFSANTLRCIMELVGLQIHYVNRFFDSDVLLVIGQRISGFKIQGYKDDQNQVVEFMRQWAINTKYYESLRKA